MAISGTERTTEYQLTEAFITSDRATTGVDIFKQVNALKIYEHIEKPYLTMVLSFADEENVIQDVDIQGGEKISITLVEAEEINSGFEIKKEFVIDKILSTVKIEERRENITLHCTEYHMFESVVQNVNRSYVGSPTTIIEKIINSHLNKKCLIDGKDSIKDMKVIIPNLNPVAAAKWLQKRCTTADGMPFYVYSPLGVDNIVIRDLGTMLSQTVQNLENPYVYAPSANMGTSNVKYFTIDSFEYKSAENLVGLIQGGNVGSKNVFYDTLSGISESIHFNVDDLFQEVMSKNLLGGDNKRYAFSNEFKVKGKNLGTYDSKVISSISSSGAYNNLDTTFKSYNDETVKGNENKKIKQQALKSFLAKSPLTIDVKSREFLTGDNNYTLGKAIRVAFLDTQQSMNSDKPVFDLKKSGDYLIIGANHSFFLEKAETQLLLGKIASLGVETKL